MTNNDEKNEEKGKTKTLSLNLNKASSPDISKILEEKLKTQKGKKIEVIGNKTPKKSSEVEALGSDKGKLTNEEKELRAKLASTNLETENLGGSPVVSQLQVVQKESLEETKESIAEKEEKTGENTPEVLETSNIKTETSEESLNNQEEETMFSSSHVIKSSFEVKVVANNSQKIAEKNKQERETKDISIKEKEFTGESEEDKKSKKKSDSSDARRANAPKNWKTAYIPTEEEEDFEEEEFEDVELKPKKSYPVKRKNKKKNLTKEKIVRNVEIYGEISVKDLATKMAEKTSSVLKFLSKLDDSINGDSFLDAETAELAIIEFGHRPNIIDTSSVESQYFVFNDSEDSLKERPPVVTIMGHVDHGKTTLLDTIRKTNIVSKEAGGITQHIGAYQVKSESGKMITFLDTPGHEAFGQIRARGSKITDIVILVVAADDGIKPQTVEAINHAKVANVPIIVAINKIDKPDSNPMKVKSELLSHNLVVEEMGGDILSVEISAKGNIGIDKLLETVLLQAEMLDLKTNYSAPAKASVIEVKQEKGFGYLATILVERGTLRVGDYFVCGMSFGKVKVMINDKGARLKEATPSTPVEISGFAESVLAGDSFVVVKNEAAANELLEYRRSKATKLESKNTTQNILDILSNEIIDVKTLAVIVKADTQGSLEAIKSSLDKITHDEVEIKIIHSGVGEITESDVMLSTAGKAMVFGFNTRANSKARDLAKKEDIELRYHSIIYNLIDDVKLILSGLLDPDIVENILGFAEVREVFDVSKVGKVAGCYVKEGVLRRSAYVRVLRENIVVHDGVLSQLKRFKDDAKEVKQEYECGVAIENYNDVKVGDIIECYEKVEVRNSIE
ncbi:MAG: translation initiation factor IF-2 [Alphaproteobacteria bacterium]|jgi:translation initiation factor IF-2|nr:translation initiation factor IF-2 [Alphaproteobacteria bacterium]